MAALANGAQTLTAGFWFLAQVIPKATGYSFFMLPSTAYNTYQIPIYDKPSLQDSGSWPKSYQRPLVIPFSCFLQPPTIPIKFLFMTNPHCRILVLGPSHTKGHWLFLFHA